MVSPYLVGALEGLEKGFAQRELKAKEAKAEDRAERALKISEEAAARKEIEAKATKDRNEKLAGLLAQRSNLQRQIGTEAEEYNRIKANYLKIQGKEIRKSVLKATESVNQKLIQYNATIPLSEETLTSKDTIPEKNRILKEAKTAFENAKRQYEVNSGIPHRKKINELRKQIASIPDQALQYLKPGDISRELSQKAFAIPKALTKTQLLGKWAGTIDYFPGAKPESALHNLGELMKAAAANDSLRFKPSKKSGWTLGTDVKAGSFGTLYINDSTGNMYQNGNLIYENFGNLQFPERGSEEELKNKAAYNSNVIMTGGAFFDAAKRMREVVVNEKKSLEKKFGMKIERKKFETVADMLGRSSKTYWSQTVGIPSVLSLFTQKVAGTFLGGGPGTGYDRPTLIGRLRVLTMQYRDLVIDDKRRGGRSSGEAEYKRFMDQFGGTSLDTLLGDDALRLKFMQAVQGRAQEIHNLRAEQVNNIAYTDQNTAIEVRDKAKSFLANLGDIQIIVHEEKMSEKKAEQLKASQGNACGSSKENGATFIEGDVVQAGGQYAVCEVKGFNIITDKTHIANIQNLIAEIAESKTSTGKAKAEQRIEEAKFVRGIRRAKVFPQGKGRPSREAIIYEKPKIDIPLQDPVYKSWSYRSVIDTKINRKRREVNEARMRKLGLDSQIRKRSGVGLLSREDRMIHQRYLDIHGEGYFASGSEEEYFPEEIRSVFGKKQRLNVKLPKQKKESTPRQKKKLRLRPPGGARIDFITKRNQ